MIERAGQDHTAQAPTLASVAELARELAKAMLLEVIFPRSERTADLTRQLRSALLQLSALESTLFARLTAELKVPDRDLRGWIVETAAMLGSDDTDPAELCGRVGATAGLLTPSAPPRETR